VLGIVGVLVGGFLFTLFGAAGVTGFNLYSMIVAIVGAIVVLLTYNALMGRRSRARGASVNAAMEKSDVRIRRYDSFSRSGWQHRQTADACSWCFGGFRRSVPRSAAGQTAGVPTQPTSDDGAGGVVSGLSGLLKKLEQGGLGNVTNSWVGSGQNQPVSPGQLGSALGPSIIKMLAQKSGLPEEELTKQLSQILPGLVDKLTPNGRVPTAAELSQRI